MSEEKISKERMKNMSLEEMLSLLDERVKQLEAEDISLEDSFQVYEEGIRLIQKCNEKIDVVEKKVLQLNEDGTLTEME